MDTLLAWLDAHADELLAVYKKLHAMPELGFKEFKTSAYLAEELRKAGYDVQDKIGGTGVVGTMTGKEPGLTLALRADMDALPMEEKTGAPFASQHPGIMHACGHDAHSAMILFAAKAIAANGSIKRGVLKILFQPAEEILEGARAIINSGMLNGVDEIVGVHVRGNKEAKLGEASPAIYHAACERMNVIIHGVAAHAAWVHRGVNAIEAVAAIVNATNAIRMDPAVSYSIKMTRCFAGGQASNIIPDRAEVTFDMRSATNEVMDELKIKAKHAIETGAASVGATAEIIDSYGVPAPSYDSALIEAARVSIEAALGKGKAVPPQYPPGSEDFHCFSVEAGIKSAYIGVGGDTGTGIHTATMSLDPGALLHGAKIFAHLAASKQR